MTRSIQEIFNVVIEEGFYKSTSRSLMCSAIVDAFDAGVISLKEKDAAHEAIRDYLAQTGEYDPIFLKSAFFLSGLPYSFEDRLAIYKDWENRPKLKLIM